MQSAFQIALLAISFLGAASSKDSRLRFAHLLLATALLLALSKLSQIGFLPGQAVQTVSTHVHVYCSQWDFFLCCFPSQACSLDNSSHLLFSFTGLSVLSDLSKGNSSVETCTCWISKSFSGCADIVKWETSGSGTILAVLFSIAVSGK